MASKHEMLETMRNLEEMDHVRKLVRRREIKVTKRQADDFDKGATEVKKSPEWRKRTRFWMSQPNAETPELSSQPQGTQPESQSKRPSSPDRPKPKMWKECVMLPSVAPSSVLQGLAGSFLSAYFLVSGIAQVCFGTLTAPLCGVEFTTDNNEVSWLCATCIVTGLCRLLLCAPFGRPAFDPSLFAHPPPPKGEDADDDDDEDDDFTTFNHDISVLSSWQVRAGMFTPRYFYRTVLIAWIEGLICILYCGLHCTRLYYTMGYFSDEFYHNFRSMDRKLNQLFSPLGANMSVNASLQALESLLRADTESDALGKLQGLETAYRLAWHNCQFFCYKAAQMFSVEDVVMLGCFVVCVGVPLLINCVGWRLNFPGFGFNPSPRVKRA